MVKKKVGGAKRYLNKSAAKEQSDVKKVKEELKGPPPPKHLQRKVAKKVGFLDKVARSAAASLGVKKAGVNKKKSTALQNLSSLTGVLDDVQKDVLAAEVKQKTQKGKKHVYGEAVKTSKARASIQATETARMQQVLHHPVYLANPIAAITNHLKATLPAAATQSSQQRKGMSKADKKKLAKQRKQQQEEDGMDAD